MHEIRNFIPVQLDIKNRLCIIVGGGKVALRKLKVLLNYQPDIIIITKEVKENEILSIKENNKNVSVLIKDIKFSDLKKAFLIIIATNDKVLNKNLSSKLIKKGYLVNDATKQGNVDFSASFNFDDITVGISTGGVSPEKSKKIKNLIIDFFKNNV